jgi:hypothetical protein
VSTDIPIQDLVVDMDKPRHLVYKLTPANNLSGFFNRRQRSWNARLIERTQRNQRDMRRLENGRERQIREEGSSPISDMRVTAGEFREYAIPKVLTRGAREGMRFLERNKKLEELCIDQRCRKHMLDLNHEQLDDTLEGLEDTQVYLESSGELFDTYHRREPVTPRTPTGPLNDYVAKTGRYSDV